MCRLFETIRIEADGSIPLLPWHLARMERSRSALFNSCPPIALEDILQVPDELTGTVVRCRVDYGIEILEVRFEKYIPRIICSLSMVQADDLSYPHKFAERNRLDGLRHAAGTDE
ncbi:MAG: 4-amino-4-deoxychorismate lyase, partial [Bacteroidales bacterium]|nr:4-amino-4-deoxychorismate lyase [Bacteroidales bacterium]